MRLSKNVKIIGAIALVVVALGAIAYSSNASSTSEKGFANFEAADKNGDGAIDRAEFASFLKANSSLAGAKSGKSSGCSGGGCEGKAGGCSGGGCEGKAGGCSGGGCEGKAGGCSGGGCEGKAGGCSGGGCEGKAGGCSGGGCGGHGGASTETTVPDAPATEAPAPEAAHAE
ncbi:MAG: hypothetical protein IJU03_06475 [Thermoguttaceae bacterium]|nr:hypothetical protein [Thermoguttaceae bacterium]